MYCVLLMIISKGLYGNELLAVNMKIVLEILLDIFGPGRKIFGHPAPTTRIFGHRNFCRWPFLGEKRPKIAILAKNSINQCLVKV